MQTETSLLLAQARRIQNHGGDTAAVLPFLHVQGCSKVDSIKLLRELDDLTLAKAKERVYGSVEPLARRV